MKIAVFLGALHGNDNKYVEKAQQLGKWIAETGNTLVYGAYTKGMMGAIADAAVKNGGKVTGAYVRFKALDNNKPKILSDCIETETLTERKLVLIDNADVYVALPGGVGTLDEITDIISLASICENEKPCIIYNMDGFYQPLKDMFDMMLKTGFAKPEYFRNLLFFDDLDEIKKYLTSLEKKGL